MRKIVLLVVMLPILIGVQAQNRIEFTKAQKEKIQYLPRPDLASSPLTRNPDANKGPSVENSFFFDHVGTTMYDLYTQGAMSGKLTAWNDESLACVFQYGMVPVSFPDRGTAYNFYNGYSWLPLPVSRIENVRTGYPTHSDYLEDGEMIVAHDGADSLIFNYRNTKGYGAWSSFTFQGPDPFWNCLLWPKIVTSGYENNNIHLLASTVPTGPSYFDLDPALLYSRSSDGGLSWDPHNLILPGMTSNEYLAIPIESYAWAEPVGDTIAFMVSDTWQNDTYIMKSCDNGDTWAKTMIWQHPYPFFNWDVDFTDTLWAPDGSHDIVIGSDGKAHCVFGICRVLYYQYTFQFQQWPLGEGIAYWNEDMPAFAAPNGNPHDALNAWDYLTPDYNLIGWTCDVDGNGQITFLDEIYTYRDQLGLSTMPTITIMDNGLIDVIYATTTETYYNNGFNFKHLWHRHSYGGYWSEPEDMTDDIIYMFEECIFPCFAKNVDDNHNRYFLYMADPDPGLAVYGQHPYQENKIYVNKIHQMAIQENSKSDQGFQVSIPVLGEQESEFVFFIETGEKSMISIQVYNSGGFTVVHQPEKIFAKGKNRFSLNLQNIPKGVYLCSFTSGNQRINWKLLNY